MSRIGHNFEAAHELAIPEDVTVGAGWTERMIEMAVHIGAYRTLQLVDRFGGMRIYVPKDPERGKAYGSKGSIVDLIGIGAAAKLSAVYGGEYFLFPTAKYAVDRAKRAPILAAVRAGTMTAALAARMLKTSRPYLSHLVNQTDEGEDARPRAPTRQELADLGQLDMFGDGEA